MNDYDYMMGLTDYTPFAVLVSLAIFWFIGWWMSRGK